MTINGSTNNSQWTYKLEVSETATSIQSNTSTVQVKTYLGRASSQGPIGGNYNVSVTCDGQPQSQSGNITWPTYINGGAWLELKTFTFTVTHNADGTKTASISSSLSSSDFTPSYASASGSITLTALHTPPTINTATMVETNSVLTALNVPNTTIVQHLSKKTITLSATAYDNATLTYRLRHLNNNYAIPSSITYQSSNAFSVDYTSNDISSSIGSGKANLIQDIKDSLNGTATDWVYVSINNVVQKPNAIAYTKPTLERTSTTIKRKSGNGVNLTDNKAELNLVGTIYKVSDVIGNANSITQIGYKIWERDTTEPSNYTTLTPTIDGNGNVSVSNVEISNIDFTKVYYYKFILKDYYNYSYIIEDSVPLGQPTWTEYRDRVDFLRITRNNKDVYPNVYSTSEEIIAGKWINNKPIYRKVIELTTVAGSNYIARSSVASNINLFTKIDGITIQPNTNNIVPVSYYYNANDYSNVYINDTNVVIRCGSNYGFGTTIIVLEYTKTTD